MWHRLKLTNFRKHRDLEISFGAGVQVIRGENEFGKTTLGEGAAYALFGAKALRNSLDDTVTWGEKPSTLRVELDWFAGGSLYCFTRHKGGAEVTLDGKVLVVGQTEVTNFAAQLVGADASMASNLMFANQNNLRGALEQGPKATAEVIEDLADFDLFDVLIERMQERLTLGSDKVLRDRLQQAQERLEVYANPEKPDTSGLEARKTELHERQTKEISTLAQAEEALTQARSTLTEAKTLARARTNAESTVERLTRLKTQEEEEIQTLQELAARPLPDEKIAQLEAQSQEGQAFENRLKSYGEIERLMAHYPEVFWEGDKEGLRQAIQQASALAKRLQAEQATYSADLAKAEHDLVHDRNCPTCGQDVTKVWDIEKRNQVAQAKIDICQENLQRLQAEAKIAHQDHDDLQAVLVSGEPFERLAAKYADLVHVDTSVFPPRLVWEGEVPSGINVDVEALAKQIQALKGERDATLRAQTQLEAQQKALAKTQAELAEALAYLQSLPAPANILALEQAVVKAETTKGEHQDRLNACKVALIETEQAIQSAQSGYERALEMSTQLKKEVDAIQAELRQLEFNNALLKKVRAARPVVSDKLWAIVLSAVSKMFSQMRGEQSVVTKGAKGFMVNGQNITSLSGSALDLLGLSIRCALIKTFVPEATTLLLDEPAAACSEERTASLLAFIRGAGFPQVILITHEDLSEQVCDGLVTL
jgi:DNA repair exonuclease SbcCD ATPase subunit